MALRKVWFSTALSKKKKGKLRGWQKASVTLRGYKFKETKHNRFGKTSAATEAEEIDDRPTEADVNALRRSIEQFFSFYSL